MNLLHKMTGYSYLTGSEVFENQPTFCSPHWRQEGCIQMMNTLHSDFLRHNLAVQLQEKGEATGYYCYVVFAAVALIATDAAALIYNYAAIVVTVARSD